jgi:hypothetical protein
MRSQKFGMVMSAFVMSSLVLLVPSDALGQGCLNIFGREHCPNPGTSLDGSTGVLIASGASSAFVEITTAFDNSFGVKLDPVQAPMNTTGGSNFAAVGVINGFSNQTVGTIYVLWDATAQEFEIRPSIFMGTFEHRVDVFDDGVLAGSQTIFGGGFRIKSTSNPGVIEMGYVDGQPPMMSVRFDQDAAWAIDGGTPISGDEIHIVGVDASRNVDILEFCTMESILIPSFTILSETPRKMSLNVEGSCPGPVDAVITGATPNGVVALVYGTGRGTFMIPGGPCGGTQLGLDNSATLLALPRADANGAVLLSRNVPGAACGRVIIQAVDASSCNTSNTWAF